MVPRKLWSAVDYARAIGRESETCARLRAMVAAGLLTMPEARAHAIRQEFNPDLVGKAPEPKGKTT